VDAVALITRDHRTAERLFQRLRQAPEHERRPALDRLIRELWVHSTIEDEILYPSLREVVPPDESSDRNLQGPVPARSSLHELERMAVDDPAIVPKLRSLLEDLRTHIRVQEEELLPQLERTLPPGLLHEVGEEMERAKQRVTRPGDGLATAGSEDDGDRAAALVDRIRDRVAARRSM